MKLIIYVVFNFTFFKYIKRILIYIIAAPNPTFPANLGEASSHIEYSCPHTQRTRIPETCATYDNMLNQGKRDNVMLVF